MSTSADDLSFECPRCLAAVTEEFYGPCASCVDDLRATGGEGRVVDAVEYEPRINVVANQIATKE